MKLSSLQRRIGKRVHEICLHECGHAVANHLLRYGTYVLGVEKARWKHGGTLQGWCYGNPHWKRTPDLGKLLDQGICHLAGYAAEILCGVLGDYDLETLAGGQVIFHDETADLEAHFEIGVDLWRRFPEYRRAIGDLEHAEAGLIDAVHFLRPYREEIEKMAATLEEKFWASKDLYAVLFPEDVERIIGVPPSGMLSVPEAARLLGIHRKKVPALPGVVTFSGVHRVPASLVA